MRYFIIVAFVSILAFGSCKRSQTASTGNLDALSRAYAELLVLNEHYTLAKDTISAQEYESRYRGILQKYNFTKEEFVAEYESVSQSPESFRQLCDLTLRRLQEMRSGTNIPGARGRS
jgi:hypothetical protein